MKLLLYRYAPLVYILCFLFWTATCIRETLINYLYGRIAALRGARNLNISLYMPRFLRSVRLALHPAQTIDQHFLRSDFSADDADPEILNQAWRMARGEDIYRDINAPPFVFVAYPPLYFWFSAFLLKFTGLSFLPGRLISFPCIR